MKLASHLFPAASGASLPPLIIAHGLFGSGRNWGVIAKRLADRRDVVTVDMRNHGDSPRADSQSYHDMAGDLAETVLATGAEVDMLGHSMGGKAAMVLALTQPQSLRRLVVADIAPVAYGHDQSRHIEAMRSVDPGKVASRAEADQVLAAAVPDAALRSFFLQSIDLRAVPPRWRLNLDTLQAEMPKIVGWPDIKGRFDAPTLFLTGADSTYVKPEYRPTILQLFPKARFAKLAQAGHWLHAEQPRAFEETVRVFLEA
jgi:esterase